MITLEIAPDEALLIDLDTTDDQRQLFGDDIATYYSDRITHHIEALGLATSTPRGGRCLLAQWQGACSPRQVAFGAVALDPSGEIRGEPHSEELIGDAHDAIAKARAESLDLLAEWTSDTEADARDDYLHSVDEEAAR